MKRGILLAILCLGAVLARAETPQLALGYVYQGSQPVPGTSWFGLNGGRGDVVWNFGRYFAVVGEAGGTHAKSYGTANSPLTMFTGMAGPRLYLIPRGRKGKPWKLAAFVQVLGGAAYASEGQFPQGPLGTTVKNTALSMAASAGGGIEMRVHRNVAVRLIQVDYLYTQMPNLFDNYQSSFRVGAGVVFNLDGQPAERKAVERKPTECTAAERKAVGCKVVERKPALRCPCPE